MVIVPRVRRRLEQGIRDGDPESAAEDAPGALRSVIPERHGGLEMGHLNRAGPVEERVDQRQAQHVRLGAAENVRPRGRARHR